MLVLLYVFSTLYHSVRSKAKHVLQKFDHLLDLPVDCRHLHTICARVAAQRPLGLVAFWRDLGAGAGGHRAGNLVGQKGARILSLIIYVLMGWLAMAVVLPLWKRSRRLALPGWQRVALVTRWALFFYVLDRRVRRPARPVAPVCTGRQHLPLLHPCCCVA